MKSKKVIRVVAMAMACILCAVSAAGCGAASDTVESNPQSDAVINLMDEVKLTDEEMVECLVDLGDRIKAKMLETDPNADVAFVVNEDGSCGYWAAGTQDDGSVSELSEINHASSVRVFFEAYLNAGFFDVEGNILGGFEETAEADAADTIEEEAASDSAGTEDASADSTSEPVSASPEN